MGKQGLGSGFKGLGFQGLGFQGLGFQGLGFGVEGWCLQDCSAGLGIREQLTGRMDNEPDTGRLLFCLSLGCSISRTPRTCLTIIYLPKTNAIMTSTHNPSP